MGIADWVNFGWSIVSSIRQSTVLEKSRLGNLLIKKGFITPEQLSEALRQQRETGKMLGEVLVAKGLITNKQLNKALKKQSRYRLVAAFTVMVMGPIAPMAFGAGGGGAIQPSTSVSQQRITQVSGLQAISDDELGEISAQGAEDLWVNVQNADGLALVSELAQTVIPGMDLLEAEVSTQGITYGNGKGAELQADGTIKIKLPTYIEKVSYDDIRVKGGDPSQSFGSLEMTGVSFGNTELTVSLR